MSVLNSSKKKRRKIYFQEILKNTSPPSSTFFSAVPARNTSVGQPQKNLNVPGSWFWWTKISQAQMCVFIDSG